MRVNVRGLLVKIGKTIKCIELSGIIKFLEIRIYQSAAKVFLNI